MAVDRELLRELPKVDDLLKSDRGLAWLAAYPRRYVLDAVRAVIEGRRSEILLGKSVGVSMDELAPGIETMIKGLCAPSLRPVINATGIVVHTNLGRSALSESAIQNVVEVARGYSNLEYEIDRGARGERYSHITRLLCETTGAEDGLAVNNNAAAVLVAISALARGREVIVSRGELVEIGGSFRIPDVMAQSGAILREVGTTNKTHLRDYEEAISEKTALILKVHQSNYRITGFTEEVPVEELVALGRECNVPVMHDLGSGCLVDLGARAGIHGEPTVRQAVKAGPVVLTFSGDKLLGGPQAGIIVGSRGYLEPIRKHPLLRALRIDKLTLAALEATLRAYIDEDTAIGVIPTLKMLLEPTESVKKRAQRLAAMLNKCISSSAIVRVIEDETYSGGGALPMQKIKSYSVSILPAAAISVNALEERLRLGAPHVIARINGDALLLNLRTVPDSELKALAMRVCEALT